MDKKLFKQMMNNLNKQIEMLTSFSPRFPSPAENPHSTGLIIKKDTEVSQIPESQVPLFHTMLHLFYENKSGKGLSEKTIEKLHKEIVIKLKNHKTHDRLDIK